MEKLSLVIHNYASIAEKKQIGIDCNIDLTNFKNKGSFVVQF
jgi:hypothetical protein